ncbi:MAG: hypothetical protein MJE77_27115 [Proteobacteria bacterium]|nr:hypothetical protein [Pseudomonadota bacterium]
MQNLKTKPLQPSPGQFVANCVRSVIAAVAIVLIAGLLCGCPAGGEAFRCDENADPPPSCVIPPTGNSTHLRGSFIEEIPRRVHGELRGVQ